MSLMLTSHFCSAVLLRCLYGCVLIMIQIIGVARLVSQYLSFVKLWSGMRIARRQLGAMIIMSQDGRFLVPSACTLSWVSVRELFVPYTDLYWYALGSWMYHLPLYVGEEDSICAIRNCL